MSKESSKDTVDLFTVRKILKLIFWLLFPILLATLIITFFIELSSSFSTPFGDAIRDAFGGIYLGIDILMGFICSMIFLAKDQAKALLKNWEILNEKVDVNWEKHLAQDRDQLNEIFGNANIVLQIDIEEFDTNHVRVIQNILDNLSEDVNAIYAIDASQPSQWWTNSMLGYLAIQGRWASHSKDRKVHRFFILNRGEMSSLLGEKLIQMHALLGFETYIILDSIFDELYKQYSAAYGTKFGKKECFVWKNPSSNPSITTLPENFSERDIYGYQSFWSTDTAYGRKNEQQADIKGNLVKVSELQIKFEYFTEKYKEIADQFFNFILFLNKQAHCCNDGDDVTKNIDKKNLVILIPPERSVKKGKSSKSMDIDIVSDIIKKYWNYCDNMYKK